MPLNFCLKRKQNMVAYDHVALTMACDTNPAIATIYLLSSALIFGNWRP